MTVLTPRPGILEIEPYVGGESTLPGHHNVIKLSSNENALGASPRVAVAMRDGLPALHRYPDGSCKELRQALSLKHKLSFENIVCGAGSDELIGLVCRAYAGPGDNVLYTQHGFLMYPIAAKAVGATPIAVAESNLTANIAALLDAVNERTRIVFLANPNNPTGTYLSADALVHFRRELRDDIVLVIDAAYAEYVEEADYTAGERLVEANNNVVMMRTFSKIYGLAALRCGWCYGPRHMVDVLNRLRNPFNVSGLAQYAALAALADEQFLQESRRHVVVWRKRVSTQLRQFGFKVPPSFGNFILAHFSADGITTAAEMDSLLRKQSIIVRRMDSYGLPEFLRITIGNEAEMKALLSAFSRISR